MYKGETARIEGLLSNLSSIKIKEWDVQIQAEHLEGSTDIATDIGPAGSTCLNVTNLDAGNQGEWEVIVVS